MFIDNVKLNLLGLYSSNPRVLLERREVIKYYNFYQGGTDETSGILDEATRGQSWLTTDDLDYEPTKDIRNHTKKLLLKQARFMFGAPPTIMMKPLKDGQTDIAEEKRKLTDYMLDQGEGFWSSTYKAFLDATIGKRVLLVVVANPGEAIKYRYYPMDSFTVETDPFDVDLYKAVTIAYQDANTSDKEASNQIWYRWRYEMREGMCWLIQGKYDGNAIPIEEKEESTGLDEIPAKVIVNGGLSGDLEGESDVELLLTSAFNYNRTVSDFKDALKFRMFEQMVFTDVAPESFVNLKIAPNSMIDLKSDLTKENSKADAKMLSSQFSFVEATKEYLTTTKSDMYELMDQPKPEDLKSVDSAKGIKYLMMELKARCEEKWLSWEPAIKWAINFSFKCVDEFNLYPELKGKQVSQVSTNLIISHNYPIPEDEEVQKEISIKEVTANVKSIKTYIREFGDVENENEEFAEILNEMALLMQSQQDQFDVEYKTLNQNTDPAEE